MSTLMAYRLSIEWKRMVAYIHSCGWGQNPLPFYPSRKYTMLPPRVQVAVFNGCVHNFRAIFPSFW